MPDAPKTTPATRDRFSEILLGLATGVALGLLGLSNYQLASVRDALDGISSKLDPIQGKMIFQKLDVPGEPPPAPGDRQK